MTERQDAPSDGLVAETAAEQDWEAGESWQPGDDWVWVEPPYDAPPRPVTPAPPPWYRRPGVLVGLIITAMVALVVASVVLLTNARFGEVDDVRLRPTIHTSAVTLPSAAQRTAPASSTPATSATSSEPTRSSAPSEGSGPVGEAEPPAPAPPAARAPAEGPGRASATPDGPRTNVTRNPMSFTPGG